MEAASGPSTPDPPTVKYQKLASEYSKIRAQMGVLKKAVFDEQANVLELKGTLKDRDHIIRINEQETESLTFRNQQLTRRVAILQEELDERLQKQRGKNKHKSTGDSPTSPPQFTNQILLEELEQKIHDNERLHQQIYNLESEHERIVCELQKRLEELENKSASHDRDVSDMNYSNQALMERLQLDRARLEGNLQTALKDLRETNIKAEMYRDQLNSSQQNLGSQLHRTTEIMKTRLPFTDTNNPELNVPPCSRRSHEQSRHLVEQAGDLVTEISAGLSKFHTYCRQRAPLRLAEYSGSTDVGAVQLQLIRHLRENASYVHQMELSFRELCEGLRDHDSVGCFEMTAGFDVFVEKLASYVSYMKKLMPYQTLSLQEESGSAPCPANLAAKNRDLLDSWLQLIAAFDKLRTYSKLLTVGLSGRVRCKALKSVSVGIADIHRVLKDMSVHYNGKLVIERSLPFDRIEATDESVVTALVSLVVNFGKLSNLLVDQVDAIYVNHDQDCHSTESATPDNGMANRFIPLVAGPNKRRPADNIASTIEEGQGLSAPYAEALRNRNVQNSTESRESLALQLSNLQEKITSLEQSREHWMLEYQLLRMKQEKLQSGCESAAAVKGGELKEKGPSQVTGTTSIPTLIGQLDVLSESEEALEGDDNLRRYFVDRINHLIVQRQMADSKAVTFHAELCAVRKRLLITESSKRALQDQLRTTEDVVASLKEELQTTTNNYKAQLSTMSEHLANMNEKLTNQKDEIDELKFSLSNVELDQNISSAQACANVVDFSPTLSISSGAVHNEILSGPVNILEMENYRKGEVLEDPDLRLPFEGLPEDVIHMRVKAGSRITNILEFAMTSLNNDSCRQIVFSGVGNGTTKAITCVELMKTNIKNLHQMNKIEHTKIDEIWEPLKPELDRLKVTREVPSIFILLSKDSISEKGPGQQMGGTESKFAHRPEPRVSGGSGKKYRNKNIQHRARPF